jgi:dolichyl-phosphate-mannose--protein O-mannosyl transferase
MTRPIWYYGPMELFGDQVSIIVSFGNPAIWWVGIAAALASAVIAAAKKDRKMVPVFAAIASQYLPWMLVQRITFIYHFFSIVPFVILSITYCIKHIAEKYPGAKFFVYAYLGLTAVLFIWFYPVLSGMQVNRAYIDGLNWFANWVF